jgi:hypothetical protein
MEEIRLPSNMGLHSDVPNSGAPLMPGVRPSRGKDDSAAGTLIVVSFVHGLPKDHYN